MSRPNDSAKRLSEGVWTVSFAVLLVGFILLGEVIATELAVFGALLSAFVIAPALAIYTYLRVGGEKDELWNLLSKSITTEDTGGSASDEQPELTMSEPETVDNDSTPNSLATLRERYATGELTDEQFEYKVDQLLQTDSLENAAEWRERTRESTKE